MKIAIRKSKNPLAVRSATLRSDCMEGLCTISVTAYGSFLNTQRFLTSMLYGVTPVVAKQAAPQINCEIVFFILTSELFVSRGENGADIGPAEFLGCAERHSASNSHSRIRIRSRSSP